MRAVCSSRGAERDRDEGKRAGGGVPHELVMGTGAVRLIAVLTGYRASNSQLIFGPSPCTTEPQHDVDEAGPRHGLAAISPDHASLSPVYINCFVHAAMRVR